LTDPLLTPFTIKNLTLRNRIVSTSHEPSYGEDGLPKDRYRAYHVAKAKGGVGLTMIGGSSIVSRESAPAFGVVVILKLKFQLLRNTVYQRTRQNFGLKFLPKTISTK
jgi:2,4-dienoyl-CoA reductase-like NADH-dependent reductase (Old Yellow Enzyme family)